MSVRQRLAPFGDRPVRSESATSRAPMVSHPLRQLRQMGIVAFPKEGRMAHYRLEDERVQRSCRTGSEHAP